MNTSEETLNAETHDSQQCNRLANRHAPGCNPPGELYCAGTPTAGQFYCPHGGVPFGDGDPPEEYVKHWLRQIAEIFALSLDDDDVGETDRGTMKALLQHMIATLDSW